VAIGLCRHLSVLLLRLGNSLLAGLDLGVKAAWLLVSINPCVSRTLWLLFVLLGALLEASRGVLGFLGFDLRHLGPLHGLEDHVFLDAVGPLARRVRGCGSIDTHSIAAVVPVALHVIFVLFGAAIHSTWLVVLGVLGAIRFGLLAVG